jgi:DNA-binding LacI/PurR family transcriptional regulator
MRATLKDVARQANVSIKTVSNVVHNRSARVSPATRERILQVIAELGYQPNLAARQLRKAKTGILVLAVPTLDNPYFASIATHVVSAGAEHGRIVLVDHTNGNHENELMTVQGLRPDFIDGIIFDPQTLEEADLQGLDSHIPVVLIGEQLLPAKFDHVLIDNTAAAMTATSHLLEIGRTRIAGVGLKQEGRVAVPSLRMKGFLAALADAGIHVDSRYIVSSIAGTFDRSEGARAMQLLLEQDPLPDAVFCFNDMMAIGAMRAAHDRGLRIPDDIAFVGIDGNDDGQYSVPTLTTVQPDKEALARTAIDLLVQRVESKVPRVPAFHYVPHHLVVRESTIG